MVNKITSLTGSGVHDWLVQRMTAAVLIIYTLFLVGFLMLHSPIQYEQWRQLFSQGYMRVFTTLTILSVVYHTWVGMWTVFTDYVKPPYLRVTLHVLTILALFACLIWAAAIVWGI